VESSEKVNNLQQVDSWLDNSGPKLLELLPNNIDQQRFLRNISSQVKMNSAIKNCKPDTIINAIITATHLGLDIGLLGSAYIVPYGQQATLMIGYVGLIDLAHRSGTVKNIHSGVVRANDFYERTHDDFTHKYSAFDSVEARGPVVGAYCLVDLMNGGRQIETMSREDIEQVRSGSRSGNNGPWVQYFEEMAKKSVIRRAMKKCKLSPEVQDKLQVADEAEFVSAEVRSSSRPSKGTDALLGRLDMQDTVEHVEVEAPVVEALPAPPEKKPSSPSANGVDWDRHLVRAKATAKKIGQPVKRWYMINDLRKKLLKERATAEGLSLTDVEAFWDLVDEIFVPFDTGAVESWSHNCNLDVLLRVPKRGSKDHFTAAREGEYRGGGDEAKPLPSMSVADFVED
tara:strand:+ start:2449 stop:3645 length:1197 start_codon:yes stop_codon:yes gene_type:complete